VWLWDCKFISKKILNTVVNKYCKLKSIYFSGIQHLLLGLIVNNYPKKEETILPDFKKCSLLHTGFYLIKQLCSTHCVLFLYIKFLKFNGGVVGQYSSCSLRWNNYRLLLNTGDSGETLTFGSLTRVLSVTGISCFSSTAFTSFLLIPPRLAHVCHRF